MPIFQQAGILSCYLIHLLDNFIKRELLILDNNYISDTEALTTRQIRTHKPKRI